MRANLKVARFIIEKCKEVEVNLEIMKNKVCAVYKTQNTKQNLTSVFVT